MAIERSQVDIGVKQTPAARSEIARTKRDMDKIEKEANQARIAVGKARTARQRALSSQLQPSGPRMRPSFTTEGIIFGPLKISDQGFAVEGLVARIGGPLLAASVVGRVGAGVFGGIVAARDAFSRGADPLEAIGGSFANRSIDVARAIGNILGIEKTISSLGALITGQSEEALTEDINRFISDLKDVFTPSIRKEVEAQLQKKLDDFEEKIKFDLQLSSELLIQSWGLGPQALSNLRSDIEHVNISSARRLRKDEEKRLRESDAASLSIDTAA